MMTSEDMAVEPVRHEFVPMEGSQLACDHPLNIYGTPCNLPASALVHVMTECPSSEPVHIDVTYRCTCEPEPCRWDGFGYCLEHESVYDDTDPGGRRCLAVTIGGTYP